jgi:hypothetical protein
VALTNRRQSSLQTEAKTGLSSLMNQVAQGFVGLLSVLLLTGGAPSGFTIGLVFCVGVAFIAWKEKQRTEKMLQSAAPEISDKAENLNKAANSKMVFVAQEKTLYKNLTELQEALQTNLSVLTKHKLEKLAELELKKLVAIERAIAVLGQDHPEEQDSSLETPVENMKVENHTPD